MQFSLQMGYQPLLVTLGTGLAFMFIGPSLIVLNKVILLVCSLYHPWII